MKLSFSSASQRFPAKWNHMVSKMPKKAKRKSAGGEETEANAGKKARQPPGDPEQCQFIQKMTTWLLGSRLVVLLPRV
jgi:hypothetical protein